MPIFQLPVQSYFDGSFNAECSIQQSTKFGHTHFILDIYDCPYCSELTRSQPFTPEARLCHIPVAFYEAAVNWASGDKSTVREIACAAATHQNYCRFKIFWNISVKEPAR